MNQQQKQMLPKGFTCQICNAPFQNRTAKHRHIKKDHTEQEVRDNKLQNYHKICEICQKVYSTKHSYRFHPCVKEKKIREATQAIESGSQKQSSSGKSQGGVKQSEASQINMDEKAHSNSKESIATQQQQFQNMLEAIERSEAQGVATISEVSRSLPVEQQAHEDFYPGSPIENHDDLIAGNDGCFSQTNIAPQLDLIQPASSSKSVARQGVLLDFIKVATHSPEQTQLAQLTEGKAQAEEDNCINEKVNNRLWKTFLEIHRYLNFQSDLNFSNIHVLFNQDIQTKTCGIVAPATRSRTSIIMDPNLVGSDAQPAYGEIPTIQFSKIIQRLQQYGMNQDSVFYDVGSGFGKLVFQAAFMTNATSVGVEIVANRFQISNKKLLQLQEDYSTDLEVSAVLKKIEFYQTNFRNVQEFKTSSNLQVTHLYSFAARMSDPDLVYLMDLIDNCPNLKYAVVTSNINKINLRNNQPNFQSIYKMSYSTTGNQKFTFHFLERYQAVSIARSMIKGQDILSEEVKEIQKGEGQILQKRSSTQRDKRSSNENIEAACNKHHPTNFQRRKHNELLGFSESSGSGQQMLDQINQTITDQVRLAGSSKIEAVSPDSVLKTFSLYKKTQIEGIEQYQNLLDKCGMQKAIIEKYIEPSSSELEQDFGEEGVFNHVQRELYQGFEEEERLKIYNRYTDYAKQLHKFHFIEEKIASRLQQWQELNIANDKLQAKNKRLEQENISYIAELLRDRYGFKVLNEQANGGFGRVFKCQKLGEQQPNEFLAIKVPIDSSTKINCEVKALKELQTKKKKDPGSNFIVDLVETIKLGKRKLIVMKWYNNNLRHLFTIRKLNEKQKFYISYFIIIGIAYAHSLGIAHRDLKLDNILIDDKYLPKICDWGLTDSAVSSGTKSFMAPEQFRQDIPAQDIQIFKLDSWSLGVVLFMIQFGKHPFTDAQIRGMNQAYKQQELPDEIKNAKSGIKKVIKKLLQFQQGDRASVSEVRKDKVFEELWKCSYKDLDISKLK